MWFFLSQKEPAEICKQVLDDNWSIINICKNDLPSHYMSSCREPPGVPGRFTITPQRHYPLQQPGVSSVGVLPPVRWDGFRKKSILSPRNSMGILSPVTVKIARPDHHSSPRSINVVFFYLAFGILMFRVPQSYIFAPLKCVFAA